MQYSKATLQNMFVEEEAKRDERIVNDIIETVIKHTVLAAKEGYTHCTWRADTLDEIKYMAICLPKIHHLFPDCNIEVRSTSIKIDWT